LVDDVLDVGLFPIAGVGDDNVGLLGDSGRSELVTAAVIIGIRWPASDESTLTSAAITICSRVVTAWAL
jgi:precorrin-6B methylase 1